MINEDIVAGLFADMWISVVKAINEDRIRRGLKPWSQEDTAKMFAVIMAEPKE